MFDHLGVLLSVMLGLALTHLLLGVCRMIQTRGTVRPYWVQGVWSLNMLLYVLAVWFGMFWWRRFQDWSFVEFVFLAAYAIVLFLLAAMLFPLEFQSLDFEDYFHASRRWFFGLMIFALLVDIAETLAKAEHGLRAVPAPYLIFLPTVLTMAIAGWVSPHRRLHAALAIGRGVVFVAYLTLSSLNHIKAG